MPQGPPAEVPRQQLSHPTMQLPPNTILVPNVFYNSTLVFLIYVGETNMSYMCGQWMFIQAVAVDMMRHHV